MHQIPFTILDWSAIQKTHTAGEQGTALSQIIQYPGLRIRMVEYAAGYLADHWCQKGHIVHCLEGVVVNEQENGDRLILEKGMSYVVTDGMSSHRSRTDQYVRLLIIDGDFLKQD
jgi:hypothetical protein